MTETAGKMNIIGIAGKAGAGKDTVANILVEKFGYAKVSFADPLKRVALDLWGFTEEQLWGPSEKRNEPDPRWPKGHHFEGRHGICRRCSIVAKMSPEENGPCVHLSPREALQILGTEVGRSIHEQTWTTYLLRVAGKLLTQGGWYSQTEGWAWPRINEIGFNHVGPGSYPGVVVADTRFPNEANAIKRVGGRMWLVDRPGIGLTGRAGSHASETSMDGYEYTAVVPNGPLETLEERVKSIL